MTIQDIAKLEQVSERSAQRYVTVGFKGIKIPAVKAGRSFSIDPADYKAWRIACGFDPAPAVQKVSQVSAPPAEPAAVLRPVDAPSNLPEIAEFAFRPYPLPADPNGVLTNGPHPHSCNHPHPLACEAYMKREAEKLVAKYRGDPHAEPED